MNRAGFLTILILLMQSLNCEVNKTNNNNIDARFLQSSARTVRVKLKPII